jgi:hypothetical protein
MKRLRARIKWCCAVIKNWAPTCRGGEEMRGTTGVWVVAHQRGEACDNHIKIAEQDRMARAGRCRVAGVCLKNGGGGVKLRTDIAAQVGVFA